MVELTEPVDVALCQRLFVELGVWIRPFGKLLYLMPPFIISPDQLSQLTSALLQLCQQNIFSQQAPLPGA